MKDKKQVNKSDYELDGSDCEIDHRYRKNKGYCGYGEDTIH